MVVDGRNTVVIFKVSLLRQLIAVMISANNPIEINNLFMAKQANNEEVKIGKNVIRGINVIITLNKRFVKAMQWFHF